jgi:hypothetical protein
VGGGLVAVRCNSGDFGFEQRDPLRQFGLRVGGKVFAGKATRRVSKGPWAIRFFHSGAASGGSGLLSIGETVIRPAGMWLMTQVTGESM